MPPVPWVTDEEHGKPGSAGLAPVGPRPPEGGGGGVLGAEIQVARCLRVPTLGEEVAQRSRPSGTTLGPRGV